MHTTLVNFHISDIGNRRVKAKMFALSAAAPLPSEPSTFAAFHTSFSATRRRPCRTFPLARCMDIPRNKKTALYATPPSAHPPPHYQRHNPVVRTMRKGTGGYVQDIRYSQFLKLVSKRKIEKVTFNSDGTQLIGQLAPPKRTLFSFRRTPVDPYQPQQRIRINHLPNDPTLLSTLTDHNVDISVSASSTLMNSPKSILSSVFRKLLLPISIFAGLFFMFRKSSGSPMSPLGLARMKPSFNFHPTTNVTFDDVAGCDGAKLELAEVVDFLKNPESYTNNGCIIPRGVLLHGPPGTGEWIKGRTCLLGSIINHAL